MATISKTGITNGNTISATHITNIIDALDGTTANNLVFAGPVTGSAPISASAGFTGSLMGTASLSITAQTASFYGGTILFQNVSNLPSSLSGGTNKGVSEVQTSLTLTAYTASLDLKNYPGGFFPVNAGGNAVSIQLDDLGGSSYLGYEFVFFASDATNDITFTTSSNTTIVCSGSIASPRIAGTGMAVVAKLIERSGVPYKWAVIGAVK